MVQADRPAFFAWLALSALLAVFAGATNGFDVVFGWDPLPGHLGLLASVFASFLWVVISGWMIVRFRWWGGLSLLGAPFALAFPVLYVLLIYACTAEGACL